MYEKITASYDEANSRANIANNGKRFAYAILDEDFRVVERGFCTQVRRIYDPCYDCNDVIFTDISTHQIIRVQQFYVRMKEVSNDNCIYCTENELQFLYNSTYYAITHEKDYKTWRAEKIADGTVQII